MAIKKDIIIDVDTGDSDKKLAEMAAALEKVNERADKLEKELEELSKKSKKAGKDSAESFGLADTQIGSMATKVVDFAKKTKTAMGSVKIAVASTGIGLLVIAIAGLVDWMKSSEEGSKAMAITMKVLGQVIKEGPIIVFNAFKLAIQNLMLPFKELMIIMKNAKDVLTGKQSVSEAMENTKKETIALGMEMVETAKKIGNSFSKIGKGAVDAAKLENDFIVAKRKNLEEEARLNRELAATKLVMDDATKTDLQRYAELEKASKIQQEITKNKIDLAKQELAIVEANIAIGDKSIDNLDKQAEVKANLIQLEAEGFDRLKEFADKKTAIEQAAKEREEARLEKQRADLQAQADINAKALEERNKKIDAEIEADIKAEEDRLTKIDEIQATFRQKNEEAAAQTEIDKIMLQQSRDMAALEALNATEEQKFQTQKYYLDLIAKEEKRQAEESIQLQMDKSMAVVNMAGQAANILSMMAKKDSKAYKALQVAQVAASGIQSVQNAFTTAQISPVGIAFPAYPYIMAGLAGAFSLAQLSMIKSSGSGSGGGGGATQSRSFAPTGTGTNSPQFNIVSGTSGNQIAEGLNSNNKPIKAYVVGSDVSSQQELDRKTVATASI